MVLGERTKDTRVMSVGIVEKIIDDTRRISPVGQHADLGQIGRRVHIPAFWRMRPHERNDALILPRFGRSDDEPIEFHAWPLVVGYSLPIDSELHRICTEQREAEKERADER